ncbi:hypothetical protein LCGC14_0546270 [marine sediment metagenome]|uniref:ParB/Sulfiredoxin domain-containing protein n=1 Tax=marine sediment metagenome TaxID=412755 RepID=A0A0F9S9Q5_9ZZZZ|nr:hypothetical protein [bacterium]
MVEYYFANAIIKNVKLSEIKVDPQVRIRKYDSTNKNKTSHKALKNSMDKFGQLHSITLLKNYKLKAGFERYSVALELGWETISCRIFLEELTKLDELLLEITENYARKDFSSLEFFVGLAMTKREYEKDHPEIKHGKARWGRHSTLRNREKDRVNKVASDATLKNDRKNKVLSFVKYHHKFFGMAERTLYNYTRIGEAYLDNKFNKETITLFEEGELTQTQLLETLRQLENKALLQSKLKAQKKDLPVGGKSLIAKSSTESQEYSRESKNVSKAKNKTPEEKKDVVAKIRKSIVENFINSGKKETSPQKNGTLVCDSPKITSEKPSIDGTCLSCPKATVLAIRCKLCGNLSRRVQCEIDFIENRHRLRDPDLPQCESSDILP